MKKEHRLKGERRTLSREASCIDTFSKLQGLFLEKFFRHILSDYFPESLLSIDDHLRLLRLKSKPLRQLSSIAFIAQKPLSMVELSGRLDSFYRQGWMGDGPGFKHLYCSGLGGEEKDVEQGELVIVQVRMRAEIEKLENLPLEVFRELQAYELTAAEAVGKEEAALIGKLKAYKQTTLTLLVVYYGDINFHIFDKFYYCPKAISFFGHDLLVKIHVFYVSRLALLNKFKIINRIDSFDYLNDLIFQLYEARREKLRAKRIKHRGKMSDGHGRKWFVMRMLKWCSIASLAGLALGTLIMKYIW